MKKNKSYVKAGVISSLFIVGISTIFLMALFHFSKLEADPSPFNVETNRALQNSKRIVQFRYDALVKGGSDVGTIRLDQTLPPNAVITRSFTYIVTQEQSSPSGATTRITCGSASIQTAANYTGVGAGSFIDGDSTGGISSFQKVGASGCYITLAIGVGNLTAGKIYGWVEYIILQ